MEARRKLQDSGLCFYLSFHNLMFFNTYAVRWQQLGMTLRKVKAWGDVEIGKVIAGYCSVHSIGYSSISLSTYYLGVEADGGDCWLLQMTKRLM